MSEHEDVFKAFDEQVPIAPQIRIYLLSEERLPVADLSAVLVDYDAVQPRSSNETAFIRKVTIESEEQFRVECQRVSAIMAPLLGANSFVSGVYDNARGSTQFRMELRKTGESQKFTETDSGQ